MMKIFSIPTLTAICLLIMTICTSVAVAQTEISTIEALNNIRNGLTGNYVLIKDLDFNDDASYADADANKASYTPDTDDPATATNAGWAPIGSNSSRNITRFSGHFEGNGFTISNLYINRNATEIGLFGSIGRGPLESNKGVVQNIGLVNAYVKGENKVGTLVGENGTRGTIQNCYATGTVSGTNNIGGLVGVNNLFGNGIITNCYATVTVTGTGNNVGGLLGENNFGNISNCYATGTVSGMGNNVGGLIGVEQSITTVSNCFWDKDTTGQTSSAGSPDDKGLSTTALKALTATSTNWNANNWDFGDNTQYPTLRTLEVSGGARALGFVICNQPANHASCITTPVLQSSSLDFGPTTKPTTAKILIVGRNLSGAINLGAIEDPFSYAEGQVLTFMPNDQGLLKVAIPITLTNTGSGEAHATSLTVTGGSLSQDVIIPIAGFSTDLLVDTDDDDLLEINSIEDLNKVRNNLGSDYELTKNLDFADPNSYASNTVNNAFRPLNNTDPTADGAAVVNPANGQNPGFVPIGSFKGTFDGQNFTISNAYINKAGYTGLFAAVAAGSTVKNLGLVDIYVKGTSRVGGLTGENKGTITNCYSTGTVRAIETGFRKESWVGGLVGENFGKIENCYANGTVSSEASGPSNVGGLVGQNLQIITNCYALGKVTGVENGSQSADIGGLVGNMRVRNPKDVSSITNCYAAVTATGTALNGGHVIIGGLVGKNNAGAITNCYATGSISGRREGRGGGVLFIGGLVANHLDEGATITNCYATGNIHAQSKGATTIRTGGLVGSNSTLEKDNVSGRAVNCFWDRETTGQGRSRGSPNSAGLSTADFKALTAIGTATNEDDRWSANNWDFGTDNEYPALRKYKTNDADPPVQIQGDLFCPQPAPRAEAACLTILLGLEVGLESIENTNTAIRLFPNPVTDRLYVQGNGTLQVQVRNILGTTLLVTEIIETGDLDCSALPPGLYLVSVQSTTRTQTQRILKR